MNGATGLLLVCALALAAASPHDRRGGDTTPGRHLPQANAHHVREVAVRMASVAHDLRAASGQDDSQARQAVGSLWLEVNRLKREGHQLRTVEWCASDLENSLRRGQQDAAARRHILNNLDHELQIINRSRR